jgi:hypothetical protein
MRWHGRRVMVYAYGRPTDMRKGFDGLSALVTQDLARDPLSGEVFNFVSRDRVRTKGIGNNVWAGGSNKTPYGYFVWLPGTTVTLDGKAIIDNGQLKI